MDLTTCNILILSNQSMFLQPLALARANHGPFEATALLALKIRAQTTSFVKVPFSAAWGRCGTPLRGWDGGYCGSMPMGDFCSL